MNLLRTLSKKPDAALLHTLPAAVSAIASERVAVKRVRRLALTRSSDQRVEGPTSERAGQGRQEALRGLAERRGTVRVLQVER